MTDEGYGLLVRSIFFEDKVAWTSGDSVNLAIGQGYLLATPLQMANAYAALASGTLLAPTACPAAGNCTCSTPSSRSRPKAHPWQRVGRPESNLP